jgi:hypothetical protein
LVSYFNIAATVSSTKYFEINSLPMQKFVQNVDIGTGVITNLLSKIVQEGSSWPTLQPGENHFSVITDVEYKIGSLHILSDSGVSSGSIYPGS